MNRFARPFSTWEMIVLRLVAYYWTFVAAISVVAWIKMAPI